MEEKENIEMISEDLVEEIQLSAEMEEELSNGGKEGDEEE